MRGVTGIEVIPAFDGNKANVFIWFNHINLNGSMYQSRPLTIGEVEQIIDALIDAKDTAARLSLGVAR